LPGAEAATEEAVVVVIMTCFVVGCGHMYVLCFWFGGGVVCVLVNKPGAPAEITWRTKNVTNTAAKKSTKLIRTKKSGSI
jgi:hypothetical protein